MSDEKSSGAKPSARQPKEFAVFATPEIDPPVSTVEEDIRRLIWIYGADAVKAAVKEATKAKRGRKQEPDWPDLLKIFESDARDWLAGKNPFKARTNYAIAKELVERTPGHSKDSSRGRIKRKLRRQPYDRTWWTLVSAKRQSEDAGPYGGQLRALEALSKLPDASQSQYWRHCLMRAHETITDYIARKGCPPPKEMTFREVETAVHEAGPNALHIDSRIPDLLGTTDPKQDEGGQSA